MALTRLCPFCLLPLVTECICPDAAAPAGDPPPFGCQVCHDTGHVCECHPSRPWGGFCCDDPVKLDQAGEALCTHGACHCGGAGEPCPACCPSVPADGTHSITEAFTPDGKRT